MGFTGEMRTALWALYSNDAGLVAQLGNYGPNPGLPSICLFSGVPAGMKVPYLYSPGITGPPLFEREKTARTRRVLRDVALYDTNAGDSRDVDDVADYVRELHHLQPFPMVGYTVHSCLASDPYTADGENHFVRVVTLDMMISED